MKTTTTMLGVWHHLVLLLAFSLRYTHANDPIMHLSEGVRHDDPAKIEIALKEGADINVIGGKA